MTANDFLEIRNYLKKALSLDIRNDLEGNDATVEALDTIIPELKNRGYEFVTITDLFNRAGIRYENAKKEVYSYTDQ